MNLHYNVRPCLCIISALSLKQVLNINSSNSGEYNTSPTRQVHHKRKLDSTKVEDQVIGSGPGAADTRRKGPATWTSRG